MKLFCAYQENGMHKFLFEYMNIGSLKNYLDDKGSLCAVELKDFVHSDLKWRKCCRFHIFVYLGGFGDFKSFY